MESMNFSRSYLETLSSADLIKLADEHGIDIPDDLNRRFIIGELLDLSQEMMAENHSEMLVVDNPGPEEGYLPISYNETEIDVVLRIPAWAYVWWDISEADFKKATEARGFKNFVLRLSDKKYFRIDLVALYASKENDNLAISRKVRIPNENRIALNAIPGRELDISEINKISGMERLLKSHYNNYRQSFAG